MSEQTERIQSQADFVEAPYQDQSWEVIGELADNQEFAPMVVETLNGGERVIDPVFADYGGFQNTEGAQRWHLPQHLAATSSTQAVEVEENVLKFTPEELEAIKAEAFAAGQSQAIQDLGEKRLSELQQIEERMLQVFKDIATQMNQELQALEASAVKLAVEIGEKIVGHAVEINPEYITNIVRQALGKAGGAAIKTVRVSPQDLEFIQVVGVAKQLKEFDGTWAFEADDTIRAGCVVSTSAGEVDFQIDKAWERMRDAVLKSKI
jgi:flagellar biosynthesis/type III secretory pathway protein FliH